MLNLLKYILILSLISSCSSVGKIDVNSYKKAPLAQADGTKIAEKTIPVVLIVKTSEKEKGYQKLALNALTDQIRKSSKLKIIERLNSVNIKDEIRLHEFYSKSVRNSMELAEFVIELEIDKVTYGKNNANITAFLKIYSLPKMETILIKKINYKYSAFAENNKLCSEGISEMINDVVGNIVKNFYKKLKIGYILQKNVNQEGAAIFKVSLGLDDILVKNSKVSIYQDNKPEALTDSAYVVDFIGTNQSWILVKDRNVAEKIKYGDTVKNDVEMFKEESSGSNKVRNVAIGAGTIGLITAQVIIVVVVVGVLIWCAADNGSKGNVNIPITYFNYNSPNDNSSNDKKDKNNNGNR